VYEVGGEEEDEEEKEEEEKEEVEEDEKKGGRGRRRWRRGRRRVQDARDDVASIIHQSLPLGVDPLARGRRRLLDGRLQRARKRRHRHVGTDG